MIRWELPQNEVEVLQTVLQEERRRLGDVLMHNKREQVTNKARDRKLQIDRLLSALSKASDISNQGFDLYCYCDTNYDFYSRQLSISYRVGDNPVVHLIVPDMEPPPDEFLGIIEVLKALKVHEIKGKVVVISDAARCTLALQMGLRYRVPKHTENQSPRSSNFGHTYDAAIAITKELQTVGCHVEFTHRNRAFINDALTLS